MPSDSDVRLVPDNVRVGSRPSDSDVRLAPHEFTRRAIPTEAAARGSRPAIPT